VPEIEKALDELKRLMAYRRDVHDKNETFLGLGLTSRKNLCVHPKVSQSKKGKVADAMCRDLTNSWVCEKGRNDPGSVELCDWHEARGRRRGCRADDARRSLASSSPAPTCPTASTRSTRSRRTAFATVSARTLPAVAWSVLRSRSR